MHKNILVKYIGRMEMWEKLLTKIKFAYCQEFSYDKTNLPAQMDQHHG